MARQEYAAAAAAISGARRVMAFSGAGISAESGIPTFRDALTGLWARYDAMRLATPEAFEADPAMVWGWYEWRRMQVLRAQPNPGHRALVELARRVPELKLVTQNVDDLHERAGSAGVLHLHGSLHQPRCFQCARPHELPAGLPDEPEGGRALPPPQCAHCGGLIRPGVVWFGEPLPETALSQAFAWAAECDVLLSLGTSAQVYPAAQIPEAALEAGATVVHVNPDPGVCRGRPGEHLLQGPAGVVLPELLAALCNDRPV